MINQVDLATVLAALDIDPDDPDDADDVAVVRALIARRDSPSPRRGAGGAIRAVTGPQIRHVGEPCRANGPEVRWRQ